MMSQRVVLLGATGFIGRGVVRSLIESGAETVIVSRDAEKVRSVFGGQAVPAAWDGHSAAGWGHFVDGAAAVVNLVGENLSTGRWTKKKKAAILDSRRTAGRAVVEAVKAAGIKPRVVLQASAVGYYGRRGDDVLDESSAPGHGFLADVVRAWEESSREVEELGVRRIVMRSGVVLGKDGGALPLMTRPFRFFVGGPLGGGRQWFSWVHLIDEVRAILFLLDDDQAAGVYNLTSPVPVRQRALATAIGQALKRPHFFPTPSLLLRFVFGKKARETLLADQKVIPARLERAGFRFDFPDVGQALRDILG
jgi:uncharacterized protein (TIGR01777 family)